MYSIPDWFQEEITGRSDGRYRARWSPKRGTIQIEEKVQRAVLPDRPMDSNDDEIIAHFQGFSRVLEIAPRARGVCIRCKRRTPLRDDLTVGTSRCIHCNKEQYIFHFPLCHLLVDRLQFINPDRGGYDRVLPDLDGREKKVYNRVVRDRRNATEAIWKEDFNLAFNIKSVGYSGRDRR